MQPTEGQFLDQVQALAKLLHWEFIYHVHYSHRSAYGWPDLVLGRIEADGHGRLVVAELKSEKGKLTGPQERWLGFWRTISGAEVFVWRPSDWPQIEEVLQ